MKSDRERASEFRALAADLEDVALRSPEGEDRETVVRVSEDLLSAASDFDRVKVRYVSDD